MISRQNEQFIYSWIYRYRGRRSNGSIDLSLTSLKGQTIEIDFSYIPDCCSMKKKSLWLDTCTYIHLHLPFSDENCLGIGHSKKILLILLSATTKTTLVFGILFMQNWNLLMKVNEWIYSVMKHDLSFDCFQFSSWFWSLNSCRIHQRVIMHGFPNCSKHAVKDPV